VISNILRLHNTEDKPCAYKVRTTAPKRYCVRPNTGIIKKGDTVEVQILLNYSKDKPSNLQEKDRFQVQTILLEKEDATEAELKDLWQNTPAHFVSKQKLKSRFVDATNNASAVNRLVSPVFAPTLPEEDEFPSQNGTSDPGLLRSALDIPAPSSSLPTSSSTPSAPSSSTTVNATEHQALVSQRDELQREVQRLREQLQAESSLRQRKAIETAASSKPTQSLTVARVGPLENLVVRYVIIALVFFLLGKLL